MAHEISVNLKFIDTRSPKERLLDALYAIRCPYCGQRDRQPSTHLERVHGPLPA